jgi:hypothetical protein
MKKFLLLFSFTLLLSPLSSFADTLYSESIELHPGWNLVSTPRVLESHSFSLPETTDNFDVYVLNASATASWSTLTDIGQTEFTPLYGYFVNNKSSSTQTLTFNYKANIEPNDRLFERTFSKTGWYSIGVANATYALAQNAATSTDNNNPSRILSSLSGGYDSVIDVTDDSFTQSVNSVKVGSNWKQAVAVDADTLNDLRVTKGYLVYIKQAGTVYSGFQNNDALATATTTPTPQASAVTLATNPSFTATTTLPNLSHVKLGSFILTAGSEDINVSGVGFNQRLLNPLSINVNNLTIVNNTILSAATPFSNSTSSLTFPDILVPANSTQTFDVFGDVGADIGNAVTTDFEVVYSSIGSSIKNVVSTPGSTVTSVAGDPVPAGI